jgi:hypothetical protein
MFTLPADATDDDLRNAVAQWFRLVATGHGTEAQAFLDHEPIEQSLSVPAFEAQVFDLTNGGRVTDPQPFPTETSLEDLAEHPAPLVCHWIPGPNTTEKYPGFIADILHPIPVNGQWSDFDASFFVRAKDGELSLQLREVLRLGD